MMPLCGIKDSVPRTSIVAGWLKDKTLLKTLIFPLDGIKGRTPVEETASAPGEPIVADWLKSRVSPITITFPEPEDNVRSPPADRRTPVPEKANTLPVLTSTVPVAAARVKSPEEVIMEEDNGKVIFPSTVMEAPEDEPTFTV
jgi:hypothetical protein